MWNYEILFCETYYIFVHLNDVDLVFTSKAK